MIRTISAGGVVLNKFRKVLIVNQKGTSWSLSKGHVEEGEDLEEAARREIYEESGIKQLDLIKELGSYERYKIAEDGVSEDKSELKNIHFFLFNTNETDIKPVDPENPTCLWVDIEKVVDLLTHSKDKEFFLSIKKQL